MQEGLGKKTIDTQLSKLDPQSPFGGKALKTTDDLVKMITD